MRTVILSSHTVTIVDVGSKTWTLECSSSSVEQSFITCHRCSPLSIFRCRLKSHLFSLSYPAFWFFSRLYNAHTV